MPEMLDDLILSGPDGVWVDSRFYADLVTMIATIGTQPQDVIIARDEVVSNSIDLSPYTLHFMNVGRLSPEAGVEITLGAQIFAPQAQIFGGAGTFAFAAGSSLLLSWFASVEDAFTLTSSYYASLVMDAPTTMLTSSTVGVNVSLVFPTPGCALTIDNGVTLGGVWSIQAGNYQVILGSGDISPAAGMFFQSSWFQSLRNFALHIDSTQCVLRVDRAETIDVNTTIPANVTVIVDNGVILTINSNVTLTIEGDLFAYAEFTAGSGTLVTSSDIFIGGKKIKLDDGVDTLLLQPGIVNVNAGETLIQGDYLGTTRLDMTGSGVGGAGMVGGAAQTTDIQLYVGDVYANRSAAPFRVQQDGELVSGHHTVNSADGVMIVDGVKTLELKPGLIEYINDGVTVDLFKSFQLGSGVNGAAVTFSSPFSVTPDVFVSPKMCITSLPSNTTDVQLFRCEATSVSTTGFTPVCKLAKLEPSTTSVMNAYTGNAQQHTVESLVVVAGGITVTALAVQDISNVQYNAEGQFYTYDTDDFGGTLSVYWRIHGETSWNLAGTLAVSSDSGPESASFFLDLPAETYDVRLISSNYDLNENSLTSWNNVSPVTGGLYWKDVTIYNTESDISTVGELNWLAYGL